MGPVQAVKTCLRRPFRYSGRASRSEIWWFALFLVGSFGLVVFAGLQPNFGLNVGQLFLILLVPLFLYLFVLARRLHDLSLPGYLSPLLFIFPAPFGILAMILTGDGFVGVGITAILVYTLPVVLAIAMSLPAKSGPNRYGPNPLEVTP
jgi:uncharacterized membrane protein YhaH (DUF805 family)